MAYLTKRFRVRRNGEMLKRGSSSKPKNYDLCHKCGNPRHFIKDFPLLKQEFSKNNSEKAAKRNAVPFKDLKRKRSTNNVMKQALAVWGDSSGESEDETDVGDSSMIEVKGEENEYDSTFALMVQSDDDEDDDNKEVNFRDAQRNLKSYSPKKLISLASILIDTYHSLVEDRDSLTVELGEAKQTRDDLVAVVIDHKETIETLKEERNDFLGVIADLRNGKEIASVEHIRLENELRAMRTRMCDEIEKNKNLQTDLERVKNDLEKFLKWSWSLEAITAIYANNGGNSGICGKRYKNMYVADFESLQSGELSCLKGIDDDAELWHASFSLLNKLIQKDLVHGRPMSKFKVQTICDVCARGKHVKSSFKSKRDVSTSKPLELLHIDICGPLRVQSRGGKRHIFVIVDDYSRFTWTMFLRTKDETFEVFLAFVKKIQSVEEDQDGEPLLVPGEVIDMTNGKADIMSQVKELSEDNTTSSSMEPGTSITITEAVERVVDAVQDTPLAPERTQENQPNVPTFTLNEPPTSNWRHKSSYPLDNITTPLDFGVQTRSKSKYSLDFSAFLSQIEPQNIKEDLKDADWITAMQDELHQFERNNVGDLVYVDYNFFGATTDSLCKEYAKLMGNKRPGMIAKKNFKTVYDSQGVGLLAEIFDKLIKGIEFQKEKTPYNPHSKYVIVPDNWLFDDDWKTWLKGLEDASLSLLEILMKKNLVHGLSNSKFKNTEHAIPMGMLSRSEKREAVHKGNVYQSEMHQRTLEKARHVFSMGLHARFQSNPEESHLKAVKRILRYFKGRQNLVLYYTSSDNFNFIDYADTDYAGYLVDRKGTSGVAHYLESCMPHDVLIHCGSSKKLEDFGVYIDCVPLLCVNTSALNMAKNPVLHKKTKHTDVRHHFLKDNVEKGLICIRFCCTEDQIADIFTKL
ncbi:uncharacterized protein [Nicotiana sylvestris]|uniref:uncharacterized protein n=1 Tax=Nicotiana sylvestris TaxID=4096 RepID=UPI00388CC018